MAARDVMRIRAPLENRPALPVLERFRDDIGLVEGLSGLPGCEENPLRARQHFRETMIRFVIAIVDVGCPERRSARCGNLHQPEGCFRAEIDPTVVGPVCTVNLVGNRGKGPWLTARNGELHYEIY